MIQFTLFIINLKKRIVRNSRNTAFEWWEGWKSLFEPVTEVLDGLFRLWFLGHMRGFIRAAKSSNSTLALDRLKLVNSLAFPHVGTCPRAAEMEFREANRWMPFRKITPNPL